jgi:hypothetical protein
MNSSDDLTARLQHIAERAKQRPRAPATEPALEPPPAALERLPEWPEGVRGAPDSFLRGALFPAIQGKTRRALKRERIPAPAGLEIRFTGWQLDPSDFEVWQQLVHRARLEPLGHRIQFTAHALLQALGRNTGQSDHEWLKEVLARLGGSFVEVTIKGHHTFADNLLRYYRDEQTQHYELELKPEFLRLYQAGWTQIECAQRQQLRRQPLALWLHGFYATHAEPFPLKVATLHEWSGSQNKSLAGFRRHLRAALDDLVRSGAIAAWRIDDGDLVHVERTPTASQRRHLARKGKKLPPPAA